MKLWRQFLSKSSSSIGGGTESYRLTIAPDVHVSEHDEGLALLDVASGRVFLCNRTGARIWQGVEAGLDADSIADQISQECGVTWQLVSRHTTAFLSEVERRGLVVRKAASR